MTDTRTTPTALLRQEHDLILEVASALTVVLDEGGDSHYDDIERCVTFFRVFADACHHGKEEDLLFPALEANGMPRDGGPIAVMLMEHDEGRELVREMSAAMAPARAGDEGAADTLRAAALGFVELITAHIAKENSILFEMADRLIEGADRVELLSAYQGAADSRYEGHSKAELEQIAAGILQRWSRRAG